MPRRRVWIIASLLEWRGPRGFLPDSGPDAQNWYIKHMAIKSTLWQLRRVFYVFSALALPPVSFAQEPTPPPAAEQEAIDEIVVTVDSAGKSINIDALRIEEAASKVIRDFEVEQTKQEEELWRLGLRSAIERNTSSVSWGYNAQREAAKLKFSYANYLPIDRVQPATIVSVRF